jgi:phosphoribosyl-ATP pyrophosphohydrolase
MSDATINFLQELEAIVRDRQATPAEASYTSQLFAAGTQRIAQKVGEEAIEVALAASQKDRDATVSETADLLYHLIVLLADRNIAVADIVAELQSRHSR